MSGDYENGKAIEVATMLGDSVVDVKHCMDPHSGKVTSRTWALLATGVACLLVSAIAFYVSVSTAAHNAGALDYWTQVAHKPAYSYRPQMLGAGYDWLAFVGGIGGLGAIAFALLRMRDERRSPYYRIGTAPGVEQPIVGAPTEDFPLVAPQGDEFVFNFGTGMTGEVIIDGRAMQLTELAATGRARPSIALPGAYELPLATHPRIRATVGQTQFLVASVPRPRRHATPLFTGMQSRTMAYFAGSLAGHLALVLLLSFIPVDGGAAAIDLTAGEMITMKIDGTEKEDVPPDTIVEQDVGGGGPEAPGASMRFEEGTAGTDKSNRKDGHMRMKDREMTPQLARAQAIEEARYAGILGSTALTSGDMFASLDATENLASGADAISVYGAIYGAEGESFGSFGYGRNGFGKGGGCHADPSQCGIIGTGPGYSKIGLGKAGTYGWGGPGSGIPGQRRHKPGVPDPVIGRPEAVGGLDKSIIQRYIKRNVDKIRYCYEKQLLAKPGLDGTVTVDFFISPNGSVTSSLAGGLDATVANCVAEVVSHIQFPKPSGGGVQVKYPFTFHAAGQ